MSSNTVRIKQETIDDESHTTTDFHNIITVNPMDDSSDHQTMRNVHGNGSPLPETNGEVSFSSPPFSTPLLTAIKSEEEEEPITDNEKERNDEDYYFENFDQFEFEADDSENDDDEDTNVLYKPPTPDYTKANSMPFRSLCERFEKLWLLKKQTKNTNLDTDSTISKSNSNNDGNNKMNRRRNMKKNKKNRKVMNVTKTQKLEALLPPSLDKHLNGGSCFPILRLMVPDLDTLRPHLGMKELSIGKIWGDAIGLSQSSLDYLKMTKYTDPNYAGNACGDLSVAVYEVMQKRFPSFGGTSNSSVRSNQKQHQQQKKHQVTKNMNKGMITIGQMNDLLDELAMIKALQLQTSATSDSSSHSESQSLPQETESGGSKRRKRSNKKCKELRVKWVQKLINLKISPLEHKWIVRIILSELNLGVRSYSIIDHMSKYAEGLYSANKNLRTLCATLCDKEWIRKRKEKDEREKVAVDNFNRREHLPKAAEPAAMNSTIAPMLSMRTSFDTFLVDIQKRHKIFTSLLDKDDPLRSSLAMIYPAFSCEVKMDGERILCHIKKGGSVKIQTRNSVWYTKLYSPVLGPPLRRALGSYNVDVILDGEVISWDNQKEEIIPFGNNRGVAKTRKEYMRNHGLLDPRDVADDLHNQDEGLNTMAESSIAGFNKVEDFDIPGKDVWLKYAVFDILYLGGPDAQRVIDDAFAPFNLDAIKPTIRGSILNLDLWKRRRILQTLVTPQKDMVEIVETKIIRPDGQAVDGNVYFSSTESNEHGYSPMVLDSINCNLDGIVDFQDVDRFRTQRKSLKEMDRLRMRALDQCYDKIVTTRQMEGLIFKDLCTPYGLGTRFRSKGYWFKLKDDYNKGGHASDIDLVILGGQFATGMRNQGCLNSFLCGCLDSDMSNGYKYMTVDYINGQGTSDRNLKQLLDDTGYFTNTDNNNRDYGKWFKLDHGVIPDFISDKTFQHSQEGSNTGWKVMKQHYPDMWIHPKDSFILTVYAGEIVSSKDFSAGVTLRFPRIGEIRAEGFAKGPKPAHEAETVQNLHDLYYQRQFQQQDAQRDSQSQSQSQINQEFYDECVATNKFKSIELITKKGGTRKRIRSELNVRAPVIEQCAPVETNYLTGFSFMVLDGTYKIEDNSLEMKQAVAEGWYEKASKVHTNQDVIHFILIHDGSINNDNPDMIVGGIDADARVRNYKRAVEGAQEGIDPSSKRDKNLFKLAKLGVVKWTYLYATIHRLSTESADKKASLIPRKHDYLVLSQHAQEHLKSVEDMYGIHLYKDSNMFEFRRALQYVSACKDRNIYQSTKRLKNTKKHDMIASWQYEFKRYFTNEEKAIIACKRNKFCFTKEDLIEKSTKNECRMVLYPDIFPVGVFDELDTMDATFTNTTETTSSYFDGNAVSKDCEYSEVAASMPLATAMGAILTSKLHLRVTHILCDITYDSIEWDQSLSGEIFVDSLRGTALIQRLKEMDTAFSPFHKITLISPKWIRDKW